ncbi:MAG: ribose 5-phosphate isomerase A [Gammaproteobacteria bacterium HGW-Gammaproteobacteria-3]|nr:MAG: ribose 5-phosphate isomerase A [Gammaproteobacteria bacterium HGW-Gammaproteobacteria-3]
MNDKERVARHAVSRVKDGMRIGLGTGSTANYFIEALAQRCQQEKLDVVAVASSVVSAIKARQLGLPLMAVEQVTRLDLYIDGADEVAPDLTLLKGRGYDLVREKLLARAAMNFFVLVDDSKLVGHIGERFPVPVEVMPFAWQMVKQSLEDLGATAELRQNAVGDGLAITTYGSLVLDAVFAQEIDSRTLDTHLNAIPGVIEHGIFQNLASAVFIGADDQVVERWSDATE